MKGNIILYILKRTSWLHCILYLRRAGHRTFVFLGTYLHRVNILFVTTFKLIELVSKVVHLYIIIIYNICEELFNARYEKQKNFPFLKWETKGKLSSGGFCISKAYWDHHISKKFRNFFLFYSPTGLCNLNF